MNTGRVAKGAVMAALGLGLLVGCDSDSSQIGQRDARNPRVAEAPRPMGTPRATESPKSKVDDATITTQVKEKLASESAAGLGAVGVETKGGVVQLSGVVANAEMKRRAGDLVRGVDGVRDVVNKIDVRSS